MSKRLYEVARDLDLSSTELSKRIDGLGLSFEVQNHLSVLHEEQVEELVQALSTAEPTERVEKVVKTGVIRRRVPGDIEVVVALDVALRLRLDERLLGGRHVLRGCRAVAGQDEDEYRDDSATGMLHGFLQEEGLMAGLRAVEPRTVRHCQDEEERFGWLDRRPWLFRPRFVARAVENGRGRKVAFSQLIVASAGVHD